MFGKPLDQVTEQDLQELIEHRVPESHTLDYKTELKLDTERDTGEFLKDVSAFANAQGGYLIYGIQEKDAVPANICGIAWNGDPDERKISGKLRTLLDPTLLHGYTIRAIPCQDAKTVVIIRMERSYLAPHRVTSQSSKVQHQFYTRVNTENVAMGVPQLRQAFLLSETLTERVRQFRRERLNLIAYSDEAPVDLKQDGPLLVVHLGPLSAFTEGLGPLENKATPPVGMKTILAHDSIIRFRSTRMLEGKLFYSPDCPDSRYLLWFRSGQLEIVDCIEALWLQNFKPAVGDYLAKLQKCGYTYPFFLAVSLRNAKSLVLDHVRFSPPRSNNIVLPEALINTPEDVDSVIEAQIQQLYNAYGCEYP